MTGPRIRAVVDDVLSNELSTDITIEIDNSTLMNLRN